MCPRFTEGSVGSLGYLVARAALSHSKHPPSPGCFEQGRPSPESCPHWPSRWVLNAGCHLMQAFGPPIRSWTALLDSTPCSGLFELCSDSAFLLLSHTREPQLCPGLWIYSVLAPWQGSIHHVSPRGPAGRGRGCGAVWHYHRGQSVNSTAPESKTSIFPEKSIVPSPSRSPSPVRRLCAGWVQRAALGPKS